MRVPDARRKKRRRTSRPASQVRIGGVSVEVSKTGLSFGDRTTSFSNQKETEARAIEQSRTPLVEPGF